MPIAILNKFDGGTAEDLRTFKTDECEKSLNFDVFSNPHYLQPYRDGEAETVDTNTIDDNELNGTVVVSFSSTQYYICFGRSVSSTTVRIYYKTDINGTWVQGGAGTGAIVNGTSIVYKGIPYILTISGSDTLLVKATNNATLATAGTISGYSVAVKPFVHPEDNVMYIVSGLSLSRWDGTTLTTYTSILPTGFAPASLTNFGAYLAIAGTLNGKAVSYLWGRDGTINTVQGTIDFGDGLMLAIENINDSLYAVTTPASTLALSNKLEVQRSNGGASEVVKSITVDNALTSFTQGIHKLKKGDAFYFTLLGDCIYKFALNKSGAYTLTKDRLIYTGAAATVVHGFNFIGDWLWIGFTVSGGVSYFYKTNNADTYTNTSTYKTTINPGMALEDRYSQKQLVAVQISYTGAASGNTVLKYSVDGSSMTTVISDTNSAGEYSTEAGAENDGTVFLSGNEFQFQMESTGGAKIKELKYKYKVLNSLL